jgi:hypothetical protein
MNYSEATTMEPLKVCVPNKPAFLFEVLSTQSFHL